MDRNLTAIASSRKPRTTFTDVSQPPDFGSEWSQLGNMAKMARGRASPNPNPAIPKVNCIGPPSDERAPTRRVPSIGPVQENETMARVRAIKKIPTKFPIPDLESAPLAILPGSVISKYPKKDIANTMNIAKNSRFSQTLVEMLFRISGLF